MLHEIVIAGFGGQGVMSMGQLITYAAMHEGKHVSWLPSYGPEQRGGTANCAVMVSDQEIGSPLIENPTVAIVLNKPSFDKFEPRVVSGGVLIVNSSLIENKSTRTDIKVIEIPAIELATEIGEPRVSNSVILGAFVAASGAVTIDSVVEGLRNVLPERRHNLIPANKVALEKGAEFAK
jgi:2-oxoglutarate ferredoxin oxidoreductase subunit gamma